MSESKEYITPEAHGLDLLEINTMSAKYVYVQICVGQVVELDKEFWPWVVRGLRVTLDEKAEQWIVKLETPPDGDWEIVARLPASW